MAVLLSACNCTDTGIYGSADTDTDEGLPVDMTAEPDASDPGEIPDTDPETTPDAVVDTPEEDGSEDPTPDYSCDCPPHPEWCGTPAGCFDGCCPDCENGGVWEFGGCWNSCEDYPDPVDCSLACPVYSCGTAVFMAPGCTVFRYPWTFCGDDSFGLNSFWYRGPIAAALDGDYPDPDCPPEDPCCQPRIFLLGFDVTECGAFGFVPLDVSEVPGIGWSCHGTNCGPECDPEVGTMVEVHVRWYPDHIDAPQQFVLEEICG